MSSQRGFVPEQGAPMPSAGRSESRLSDFYAGVLELFRRRWQTFVLVGLIVFGLALALILQIDPQYEASARLRIDPSRNPLATQRDSNTGLSTEAIDTEVTVLRSPDLAREIVRRYNLIADPEFARTVEAVSRDGPASAEVQISAVADRLLSALDIRREGLTYVIGVRYQSRNPRRVAPIVNAVVQTYVDTRVGGRASTAEQQASFYAQQLEKLATDLRQAEARAAQYRAQAGIVQGGSQGTITDQQVAPLSTQLASAQSVAAQARARLAEARRQVAAGGVDAVSEVRSSPVIADLRRQRAEVMRNMGEITARYGPRYPETIKVRQQLTALDAQIAEEANRAIGSLQAEADSAAAQAASLSASLGQLRSRQANDTRAAVVAEGLERDVTAKRAAYDRMAQMQLDAVQSARNSISNAEIVDRASAPTRPSSPNRPFLIAGAALVALALALGFITLQELLGTGMRSIADIESRLSLPVLASVPRVAYKGLRSPADIVVNQPTSVYAEALRNARTSILGVGSSARSRSIAFTSSVPEEGKTVTALAFARVLAMKGLHTLLIDCDIRKASLIDLVGRSAEHGVVEVLRGNAPAESAILADQVEDLDLMLVRQKLFTGEDLFAAERMTKLLDGLKDRYDVIVLDLPPMMGVADARSIAALADATIMIVRWGATPPRAVQTALGWLRGDGANVPGVIFSRVDPNAEAIGGMFYSSKYAAYYQQK